MTFVCVCEALPQKEQSLTVGKCGSAAECKLSSISTRSGDKQDGDKQDVEKQNTR